MVDTPEPYHELVKHGVKEVAFYPYYYFWVEYPNDSFHLLTYRNFSNLVPYCVFTSHSVDHIITPNSTFTTHHLLSFMSHLQSTSCVLPQLTTVLFLIIFYLGPE